MKTDQLEKDQLDVWRF